jgi:hypothetical protein
MKTNLQRYLPCLRWKRGEYQALSSLTPSIKDMLLPLIDVAEIGYDFEERSDKHSIDDHLKPFAQRVRERWGMKDCYIDFHLIDGSQRMATGKHPVSFVFDKLRLFGIRSIPVLGLHHDNDMLDAIKERINQDERGLCFRINLEDAASSELGDQLNELFQIFGKVPEQCDLIIDEEAPNFDPIDGFVGLIEGLITNLPYLNNWRLLGLIGTSLPQSLKTLEPGISIIPRYEWQAYKKLVARLNASGVRVPVFGDYAINHPEARQGNQRFMKTRANIRYTINDNWLIVRGEQVRDLSEYKELCSDLVTHNSFYGTDYSTGDKYIQECSEGIKSTGNHTTWRWVGTNHHLTLVAQDVANLAVS